MRAVRLVLIGEPFLRAHRELLKEADVFFGGGSFGGGRFVAKR